MGFEPTPFRNGALSHRLRPLGQTVLKAFCDTGQGAGACEAAMVWCVESLHAGVCAHAHTGEVVCAHVWSPSSYVQRHN